MIFVTGATGLLGSFICRELIKNGQSVRAVKRGSSQLTLIEDIADQIEWVNGDMNDTTFLLEALEGVDGVIHGAAIKRLLKGRSKKFCTNKLCSRFGQKAWSKIY